MSCDSWPAERPTDEEIEFLHRLTLEREREEEQLRKMTEDDQLQRQIVLICEKVGVSMTQLAAVFDAVVEVAMSAADLLGELMNDVLKTYDEYVADIDDYYDDEREPNPRPPLVIPWISSEREPRTLRELYGQGVDAGPRPSRPGLIRPADERPHRGRAYGGPKREN